MGTKIVIFYNKLPKYIYIYIHVKNLGLLFMSFMLHCVVLISYTTTSTTRAECFLSLRSLDDRLLGMGL